MPVAFGLAELAGTAGDVGAAGDGVVLAELAGGEGVFVSGGVDAEVDGFVLGAVVSGGDDGLIVGVCVGEFVQLGDTAGLGAPCEPMGGGAPPILPMPGLG